MSREHELREALQAYAPGEISQALRPEIDLPGADPNKDLVFPGAHRSPSLIESMPQCLRSVLRPSAAWILIVIAATIAGVASMLIVGALTRAGAVKPHEPERALIHRNESARRGQAR